MTDPTNKSGPAPTATKSRAGGSLRKPTWSTIQFVLCLVFVVGVLAWLLFTSDPGDHRLADDSARRAPEEIVTVVGPRLLETRPGSPLDQRLQVTEVSLSPLEEPVMTVSGRVAASLRPGAGDGTEHWQFDSPEVLEAYTDWERSQWEIEFAKAQIELTREMVDARTAAQEEALRRMERLVQIGTESRRDVIAAQAELLQTKLEGRREVQEAEMALREAQRTEVVATRQLALEGLSPQLLQSVDKDVDIVLADVSEERSARVRVGQRSRARFFSLPGRIFDARVNGIAPVLSPERRALRILFIIDDPNDELRPGMFAEIGIGTDPRDAMLVPAEAVLHVGRADYVLTAADSHTWRVTQVEVGELHQGELEILSGLSPGDLIIGRGAILLKPYVARALQVGRGTSPIAQREATEDRQ